MEDYEESLIEKINSKIERIDRFIDEHQAMGGYPQKICDYSPYDREHILNHYRNLIEAYALIEHYNDISDEELETNINLETIHSREKALLSLFSQSIQALKALDDLNAKQNERKENRTNSKLNGLFFTIQS